MYVLPLVGVLVVGSVGVQADAQTLVHQWAFENNLNDTSASGNDGTLVGGDETAEFIAGKFGQAYNLNSAEGVLNETPNNLPLGGSDPWTMNVWLRFDTDPGNLTYYAGFGDHNTFNPPSTAEHGTARGLINFDNVDFDGAGYFFWGCNCGGPDDPDINSGAEYTVDSDWHMYTVTNDGTELRMYQDAGLVATAPNNLLDSPFNLVQVGNPSFWNDAARGGVDEFAIWDGALSVPQVNGLLLDNAIDGPASAFLKLQVDRGTGEVKIINDNATGSVMLNSYQVSSASGELRVNEWDDLAGNNGFDPASAPGAGDGWEQDASSGNTQIIEAYLLGNGEFAGAAEISLGNLFTPGGTEDLTFLYRNESGNIIDLSVVEYVGVATGLPGDFNDDGVVDAADYTVWRDNLGLSDSALNGNGTGDASGLVVQADYSLWRSQYGATPAPEAAGGAAPEPGSIILFGGLWAFLGLRRALVLA